jgi:hypothetical protein
MSFTRREFVGIAASAAMAGSTTIQAAASPPQVVELRQYTLRQARRDTLIDLFEERFLEPQNALGAQVIGTFRDCDDPDRFVWIRGFSDMNERQRSLEAFYGGSIWHANRDAANATIVDSDNVLLLRPAAAGYGFENQSAGGKTNGIIGARIHYLDSTDAGAFTSFFDSAIVPRMRELNVQPIARFMTHAGPNNFRLPIRERDRVFVWFARWGSVEAEEKFSRQWASLSGWRDNAPEAVLPAFMRKPERLRLSPTAKSQLR